MSNGVNQIGALIAELAFDVVNEDTAIGEVQGIPTAMNVLRVDPPALLFQLRLNPLESAASPDLGVLNGLAGSRAKVSVEDDCAWVSMQDLVGVDNVAIQQSLKFVADALNSIGLAVGPGCSRCGSIENSRIVYTQSRARRVCADCLSEAVNAQKERETELNRGSLGGILGLPGTGLLAAGGWALSWTLVDVAFEQLRINDIEINKLTTILYLILLAGVGYALGWPMGISLRRSIGTGKASVVASGLFALAVAVGGEILYVAVLLLRLAGIFDLREATGLLGLVLAEYSGFWLFCKLSLFAVIAAFCKNAATQRKSVRLDV